MYNTNKEYNPTAFEEMEKEERARHEEEMKKAQERIENGKRRKRKTLLCASVGVLVGIIYIIYVALGVEWVDALFERISKGRSGIRFMLDFAPPVLVSGVLGYFAARGEKGIFSYILTAVFSFMVVTLLFLVYLGFMMM